MVIQHLRDTIERYLTDRYRDPIAAYYPSLPKRMHSAMRWRTSQAASGVLPLRKRTGRAFTAF
jgi:hypothetical protein